MRTKILIITILMFLVGSFVYGQTCIGTCSGSNTSYGDGTGTDGHSITFFGKQTGSSNEAQGVFNAFFGYQTGFSNKFGTDNSFFGTQAGFHNIDGNRNSFFGRLAGQFNTASDNSFYGYVAGDSTSFGSLNSFFGSAAGRSNRDGALNSFFGYNSGTNNKSSENAFFGGLSGLSNTSGNLNSFFGSAAGSRNLTGKGNTFIGQGSGSGNQNGSFNVAIGHRTGPSFPSQEVDSTLFIDIRSTSDPLIYGQFNKRLVRINGSFEAMGGVSNSSDINRKEAIIPIDENGILEKVVEMELSEWSYKEDSNIRHLGPMAQDFYKAFGLGKNEKTIGTLDADGVALASIQALYQLWQEEKEVNRNQNEKAEKYNQEQKKLIELLITRIENLENK